jgi:hypothetical protein
MLAGICTKGEYDLVYFFIRKCNRALFDRIRAEGAAFSEKGTAEKVKLAMRWRLEMLAPYVSKRPPLRVQVFWSVLTLCTSLPSSVNHPFMHASAVMNRCMCEGGEHRPHVL